MLSSRAIRRAFQRAPLVRSYATGGSHVRTPYRFRFLLHTEEFAELLEAKTGGEAIPNYVLEQLTAFRNSLSKFDKSTPNLNQDLRNDFLMQDHDIAEMKYDLAEYYHFHIPTGENADLKTGADVANWVKSHVDRTKDSDKAQFHPRNMSGL